jgi:hypothetical protein
VTGRFDRLAEADAILDAYTLTDDPDERERFFRAARTAVEAVLRDAADRVRQTRKTT